MKQIIVLLSLFAFGLLGSCTKEEGAVQTLYVADEDKGMVPGKPIEDNIEASENNDIESVTKSEAEFNGAVTVIKTLKDGSKIIAGEFTQYGDDAVSQIVKIDVEGNLDKTFTENIGPDINGPVNSILEQEDGKLLLGGHFSYIGGTTINSYIVLTADGKVDETATQKIGDGVNGIVNTISETPDGEVILAGHFSSVDDTTAPSIQLLTTQGDIINESFLNKMVDQLDKNRDLSCQNVGQKIKDSLEVKKLARINSLKSQITLASSHARAYSHFAKDNGCQLTESNNSAPTQQLANNNNDSPEQNSSDTPDSSARNLANQQDPDASYDDDEPRGDDDVSKGKKKKDKKDKHHKNKDHASKDDRSKDHKSKDHGSKDDHSKDHKSKDHASKDDRSKDHKSKDHGSKDDRSKDHKSKDHGSKDDRSKDHKSKDHSSHD